MSSHKAEPMWILTEDYAVGIDSLNWKLFRCVTNRRTGERTGWKVIEYHPRLRNLMTSLLDAMMLDDSDADNIPEHVNSAVEAWQSAGKALTEYMNGVAGLDTLPPAYANFSKEESK